MHRPLTHDEVKARWAERAAIDAKLAELLPLKRRLTHITRELTLGVYLPPPGVSGAQLALPVEDKADLEAAADEVLEHNRRETVRSAILLALEGQAEATVDGLLRVVATQFKLTSRLPPTRKEIAELVEVMVSSGALVRGKKAGWYRLAPREARPTKGPRRPGKKSKQERPAPAPAKSKAASRRGRKAPTRSRTSEPAEVSTESKGPRPTVPVGEAVERLLAGHPPQRWAKTRSAIAARLVACGGSPLPVVQLYLSSDALGAEVDAVLSLFEEAGAVVGTQVGVQRLVEVGAAVGDDIAAGVARLVLDYVFDAVATRSTAPTTDELCGAMALPRGLVLLVVEELREAGRLRRGNQGRWEAVSAQERTAPLFSDVEPAPALAPSAAEAL